MRYADEAIIVLEADIAVDLVFADINMPGTKDGLGLAQWLHDSRPDIKMVLGSGVAGAAEKAKTLGHVGLRSILCRGFYRGLSRWRRTRISPV